MVERLRGEGDDPLARHPLLERWEIDEEFRTSVSTRTYPSVNRETIDMFLAGDLGCCGDQYRGQPLPPKGGEGKKGPPLFLLVGDDKKDNSCMRQLF